MTFHLKTFQALEQEIAKLKDALAHSKKECEDELLRRVDAENQLLSVREEREFGEQVHKKVRCYPCIYSF